MDLDTILKAVSESVKISIDAIRGKSRKRELVIARDIFFDLAKDNTSLSYEVIGDFVNRDHSSVTDGTYRLLRDLENDNNNANKLLKDSNQRLAEINSLLLSDTDSLEIKDYNIFKLLKIQKHELWKGFIQ